ncbi:MAG TPA: hypothetical protein VGC05_18525, partial [Mycobacterium sp.]
ESAPLPKEIDSRLRLSLKNKEGDLYVTGSPRPRPGRIAAYNHTLGREVSITKPEIAELSDFAAVWLDGFLSGAEPAPPAHPSDKEEADWDAMRRRFRMTGLVSEEHSRHSASGA